MKHVFRPFLGSLVLASVCLGLFACARTQMEKILPDVQGMVTARHYFGEPTTSESLPGGETRHEWLLDREFTHAGGLETQLVYVGHDSDGFRKYIEREVYVKPYTEKQYCRLTMITDAGGKVLSSAWEGTHCDYLPKVKSTR